MDLFSESTLMAALGSLNFYFYLFIFSFRLIARRKCIYIPPQKKRVKRLKVNNIILTTAPLKDYNQVEEFRFPPFFWTKEEGYTTLQFTS